MSAKSLQDLETPSEEVQRQPLDITKEFFTLSDIKTKSDLSAKEIMLIARGLWFRWRYDIQEIEQLINEILILKRSKGGFSLKSFRDTLKNMKPSFEQKEGSGEIRL